MLLVLVTQSPALLRERKNSPELGVGGSRSGTGVGVLLVELILFSSLFSIWALTHVAVAFTDACTS